jgi:hypothetical protein
MLETLALKRDQREIWLTNPMCGMYTVKFTGENKGEYFTLEEKDENADMQWTDQEMGNYRPP